MKRSRRCCFWGMRVVLPCRRGGHAGCSGLRCCGCGGNGGHLLVVRVGGRWLRGPSSDLAAPGAVFVGSSVRERCGTAVSTSWAELGWAPQI